MAGNTVYVQGNYVDVHDNEVVNLNIDKVALLQIEEDVPACLCTQEANELWEIAKQEGWVDEDLQPTVSRTEAAILADILLEKMGKEHEWTLFEKMWNRKNMRNDWQAALELKKYDEVHERMKKKLC